MVISKCIFIGIFRATVESLRLFMSWNRIWTAVSVQSAAYSSCCFVALSSLNNSCSSSELSLPFSLFFFSSSCTFSVWSSLSSDLRGVHVGQTVEEWIMLEHDRAGTGYAFLSYLFTDREQKQSKTLANSHQSKMMTWDAIFIADLHIRVCWKMLVVYDFLSLKSVKCYS